MCHSLIINTKVIGQFLMEPSRNISRTTYLVSLVIYLQFVCNIYSTGNYIVGLRTVYMIVKCYYCFIKKYIMVLHWAD